MTLVDGLIVFSQDTAKECGASAGENQIPDYIFRNNTREDAFEQGGAYFGFISPDEEPSGSYHDLSLARAFSDRPSYFRFLKAEFPACVFTILSFKKI